MANHEWSKVWHHRQLDVGLLQAQYVRHVYPRHSHDYYVLCVIEEGVQSFSHKGTKHITCPGGVILINPGAVHTGEAADENGFRMRSIYPTTAHMQRALFELTGREQGLPFFGEVQLYHRETGMELLELHRALVADASKLECEDRFIWTLAQLVKRYADTPYTEDRLGKETTAVQQVRQLIDEHFCEGISLQQLADHVAFNPYYLLRVFCAEVGMPPYAYLESVRIRQAQRLLKAGRPLAEVAAEVGFSSQSHLNQRFKRIIGVTPGQYAQQVQ